MINWADCVYGIYKRPLRAPTRESGLALIAVDVGGKNIQEQDQIRIWAAPTAGPEISTVLEGILGTWGGLWLPARERTLTALTEEKHFLFLCFDFFCRFFWSYPSPFDPYLCCSCWFYWHYEVQLSFWAFSFPQSNFLLLL